MTALYISDLDGTLLRNDASLSASSRDALTGLITEGLKFSVASARSVVSMQGVLQGLDLELPVVEFNGAFISDLSTGRHEIVNAIDADVAAAVFATMRAAARWPFVSTFDGAADRLSYCTETNEGERFYVENRVTHGDARLRRIEDLTVSLREQVVCLTVIGEHAPLLELEAEVRSRFGAVTEIHLFENAYSPGWYWLTVHDRRATKDQAIRRIMRTYGLHDHDLVVFGDQINDIKMFRIAREAVAVANAHPELKSVATHHIGTNEEESVVAYIRDHFAARVSGA